MLDPPHKNEMQHIGHIVVLLVLYRFVRAFTTFVFLLDQMYDSSTTSTTNTRELMWERKGLAVSTS